MPSPRWSKVLAVYFPVELWRHFKHIYSTMIPLSLPLPDPLEDLIQIFTMGTYGFPEI